MKRVLFLMLMLGIASGARAQVSSGNVYGTVTDQQGAVLPGVTVSLASTSIGGQPRTTVTDPVGLFRFLNLDSGTYKLTVELAGFSKVERDVIVSTGVSVEVTFNMKVSTVQETVTVTAETPVVSTKKVGTATTLSREELQSTPQSKDPWAMLKTVPGVIVDRVNVGGNESGQQSGFVGKGALATDTMWNLDGVVITDTTSGGASSMYFDFDAFDEVAINTGGNDLKTQTGGLGINFVTRRGTNMFKGSARYTWDGHQVEASNISGIMEGPNGNLALSDDPRLKGADKANHSDKIYDWGFDLGGPIVKDKLWLWGSYGKQDIKIVRLAQTFDDTILKDTNVKMNWSASKNDEFSFFYFNGAKEKLGRSVGLTGTEQDSFLWNQGNFYPLDGFLHPIHGLAKFEDNHVFGSNLFVNAKYAYFGWGYGFAPRGGTGQQGVVDFVHDNSYGSYESYTARKPWQIVDVSGSSFVASGGGSHEFKFGFGYRRNPNHSTTTYSGDQLLGFIIDPSTAYAQVWRPRVVNYVGQNYDLFFGDTYSKGRLTVNAGLRWDRQASANTDSVVTANPTFPNLLPAINYDASSTPTISWSDLSPRVSVSMALDDAHKSVLRASYARYAGQLNPDDVTAVSPAGGYAYSAYLWVDSNKDGFIQKNEVLTNLGVQYHGAGFDPAKPTALVSANKIDPNYHANHDNEFIVGLDHELLPNLSVGGAFTYRKSTDLPEWNTRIGMTSADYAVVSRPSAQGYTVAVYAPNQAKVDASGGGTLMGNRPDDNKQFTGIEFSLNKRLSNKWMSRVAFSYNNWTEHINGSAAITNPTRNDVVFTSITGAPSLSGPQVDGGQVAPRSTGSGKGDIFYNAKWQINANGFYQLGWNFELGANIFGRQGYAEPLMIQTSAGADGTLRVLATPEIDTNRYANLWDTDFRLAKTFNIQRAKVVLSADVFNTFNANTTLAATRRLNSASYALINEILAPRILRIGFKVQF